jgi:hypothetical protein
MLWSSLVTVSALSLVLVCCCSGALADTGDLLEQVQDDFKQQERLMDRGLKNAIPNLKDNSILSPEVISFADHPDRRVAKYIALKTDTMFLTNYLTWFPKRCAPIIMPATMEVRLL